MPDIPSYMIPGLFYCTGSLCFIVGTVAGWLLR